MSPIRSAVLRECEHLVITPDELVRRSLAQMDRRHALQREPHAVLPEHIRNRPKSRQIDPAQFVLRRFRRRHDVRPHARASNRPRKASGFVEFGESLLKCRVILAKLNRQTDNRGLQTQLRKQRLRGIQTGLHRGSEIHVHAEISRLCRELRKLGPGHTSDREGAVQGDIHGSTLYLFTGLPKASGELPDSGLHLTLK